SPAIDIDRKGAGAGCERNSAVTAKDPRGAYLRSIRATSLEAAVDDQLLGTRRAKSAERKKREQQWCPRPSQSKGRESSCHQSAEEPATGTKDQLWPRTAGRTTTKTCHLPPFASGAVSAARTSQ